MSTKNWMEKTNPFPTLTLQNHLFRKMYEQNCPVMKIDENK